MSASPTMVEFLSAVRAHGVLAREVLMDAGYHPNGIYTKAIKASRKGYTDYGTVADRPWLTRDGELFLLAAES